MAESVSASSLGRKVFFLHPTTLMQNQVISELAQEEFEVYVIRDEEKLLRILGKYPDSIVFASISEGMKESAWEEYITSLTAKPETAGVQIGIIASSMIEDSVKQKYEKQNFPCGYITVKSDAAANIKLLTEELNRAGAKGRRKYIRMEMGNELNATINLSINGNYVNGIIKDISVVGFSCSFSTDPDLIKNSLYSDMQLRLQSQLLKAEGIAFGSRMVGTDKVYVILFTQRVDPNVRSKIRSFIQNHLQSRMDEEFSK